MKDNALYLEVDEDITSAIDKLTKATGDSVQIVVPKRSTMLQSIINLKLLKKAAESNGKELVLVTGDKVASDLASRVGLAVAPSLGAKAELREADMPEGLKSNEEIIEASDPEPPKTPKTPVKAPLLTHKALDDEPGDNVEEAERLTPAEENETEPVKEKSVSKSKQMPKIPDWGRVQRRALWVVLLIVLIVAYSAFMVFFSSANVTLYADGSRTSIDTTFAVDTSGAASNMANGVLAGQTVSFTKSLNGTFTPTGKQDAGTKASGQMTVFNLYDGNTHTFVAGTRFQAPDGNVFTANTDITVSGATVVHGQPVAGSSQPFTVTATQNGDQYNEAAADYSMPGLPASEQSTTQGFYAQGAQMSGGTTKTVTVVQQSDVDTAVAAALAADQANVTSDLAGKLPSGYMALTSSQSNSTANIAPTPAVGTQGDSATVALNVTYTELAVKQSDYKAYIDSQEQQQIGTSSQIYDDGLSSGQISSSGQDSSGRSTFHFTTSAYAGNKIDEVAIAKTIKGDKYGDAVNAAAGVPGVTQATITLFPTWSSNLPSSAAKIHVTIKVASNQ